jgi:hypothetical protein
MTRVSESQPSWYHALPSGAGAGSVPAKGREFQYYDTLSPVSRSRPKCGSRAGLAPL